MLLTDVFWYYSLLPENSTIPMSLGCCYSELWVESCLTFRTTAADLIQIDSESGMFDLIQRPETVWPKFMFCWLTVWLEADERDVELQGWSCIFREKARGRSMPDAVSDRYKLIKSLSRANIDNINGMLGARLHWHPAVTTVMHSQILLIGLIHSLAAFITGNWPIRSRLQRKLVTAGRWERDEKSIRGNGTDRCDS